MSVASRPRQVFGASARKNAASAWFMPNSPVSVVSGPRTGTRSSNRCATAEALADRSSRDERIRLVSPGSARRSKAISEVEHHGGELVRKAFIITALAACAFPAGAIARQGVSGARKAPIVKAGLGGNIPIQCAAVYISTVSRFWASATFDPQRGYVSACQMYGSNGVTILHHVRGRWRFVTAGSAFTCPVAHVPASIARDLRVPCAN
jgi:hypothetical protein